MTKIFRIAIDGPSGAGKSTIAKRIAAQLNIDYIDTGAMYRAVALKLIRSGVDAAKDQDGLNALLAETTVDFSGGRILLDGEDVSGLIRTPEVTAEASRSSAVKQIREKLVALQRGMGEVKSVVMDGRDIGTNVFKDAEYKFYMTASAGERARRRFAELEEAALSQSTGKGAETTPAESYEEVLVAIEKRDYDDSHRELNPLMKADDAVEIDTDGLSIEEVTDKILSQIYT
jgi:cytidylate kinase